MANLDVYFDFLSPYAYLGWHGAKPLAAEHGLSLRPRPVLFAALLGAHGHKGPAEIPPKRLWVFKETFRRAALAGLPFGPPESHPFRPLLALRCVLAAPEAQRPALVDRLFAEAWGGEASRGLQDPETVARRAHEAGLDGAALVAAAGSDAVKASLRAETEAALARGVFGVPTYAAGDELFWGYDALDLVALHLDGKDPLDAAALEAWADLPASARRAHS
ncbi:MAG: 2-hydroxychromene-2-carboxylate isomerase [Myxococcota bacterium]